MDLNRIETNLEYRTIERDGDRDYFIESSSYPVNLMLGLPHISRIQFPKSRAILIRTSPGINTVTVHVMRDIDLHSSFANFEIELGPNKLVIKESKGQVDVWIDLDF